MRRGERSTRGAGEARAPSGLTMVELLITASIVAVALLAIATIFPVALNNIDVGGDETSATAVGQGFTEMARNVDWNTLTAFNGLDTNNSATCPGTPAPVNAACLTWIGQVQQLRNGRGQVTVAAGPGLNPDNLQQLAVVTVAVSYTPRETWLPSLVRRQVVLTTRRSQ